MMIKSGKAYCTTAEWLGRAQCGKCHIRKLMFFSELPESAFDTVLQPIDQLLHPPGSVLYAAIARDARILYRKNNSFLLLRGEDMSIIIGISVETVSRVIVVFNRQKIHNKTDDNLYTCNVPVLKK